jgi:catechol 2,3-dioxygenase-like lactoylglutathione lyase family enzyme
MAQLALHHVNLIVTDLPRSLAFYQNLFGLTIIERPPFKGAGAWLACGALQVPLSVRLLPHRQRRRRRLPFCFPHR